MGHYLSEMQGDPEYTGLFREWKDSWKTLREAVGSIKLSELAVEDISEVQIISRVGLVPREVGGLYRPVIDAPLGFEEARDAAKRLLKKYGKTL